MLVAESTGKIARWSSGHWLLGLPVDNVRLEDVQERIVRAAADRTSFVFVTPNLNFLRTSRKDGNFRRNAMSNALSLADGMPLVWLGRLFGLRLERVAGSTVFEGLVAAPLERKLNVFFFGGPDGAAAAAFARINRSSSGLRAVGALNPGFGSVEAMSSSEVIDLINGSGADFLVVALGARKGLAWIEENRAMLQPYVISHLGAVVNFAAGTLRRAPTWMQRLGLEWLWRMQQEPALVFRYTADAAFMMSELLTAVLPLLAWHAFARLRRPAEPLKVASEEGREDTLFLSGSLTKDYLASLIEVCERRCCGDSANLVINLDGVQEVDCRALGYLYELKYRRITGGDVVIVGGGRRLRRLMRWHRADVLIEPSVGTRSDCVVGEVGT